MAKFNRAKVKVSPVPNTVNAAGGVAYKMSDKKAFVEALLTSFVSNTFHQSQNDIQKNVETLIGSINDPLFAAKASVYAREHYNMRSITHFVAAQLAARSMTSNKEWATNFFDKVVVRVGDMTEIMAAYFASGGKKVPSAMKKGFANAFNRFDGDTISKYTANNSELKLVDIVNLVHPKPTAKNKVALNALINGKLKNLTTSNRALTIIGQSGESEEGKEEMKVAYWRGVLENRKIGYLDLLRNLVRINEQPIDVQELAAKFISNPVAVQKSRVMPYTIYLAYKVCVNKGVSSLLTNALQDALESSIPNIPRFEGKTVVVVDSSGSMSAPVNSNNPTAGTTVSCNEVANLMAALLAKASGADIATFADDATYHNKVNLRDSAVTIAGSIRKYQGGTDFTTIFPILNKKYDRVIILSDMFGWMGTMEKTVKNYKAKYNANPKIYMWNLATNGTIQAPEKDVYLLAGFSDKCFEALSLLETDRDALLKEIDAVEI